MGQDRTANSKSEPWSLDHRVRVERAVKTVDRVVWKRAVMRNDCEIMERASRSRRPTAPEASEPLPPTTAP